MNILLKIIGIWVFIDGILSMFGCKDRRWICQVFRIIRAALGVTVFFISFKVRA